MPKTVAIIQSNYIPWKGYFDIIAAVDEFILFDDMQYTRRDWRNRNRIKTHEGLRWLTIPVEVKGKYLQRIDETRIIDTCWTKDHWATIVHNYGKAPCFRVFEETIGDLYASVREPMLSRVNRTFLEAICNILGIGTRISWSTDYPRAEGKTERLVGLCRAAGAARYLSGPAAKGYIVPELFEQAGIALDYMDYNGYPEYPQLHGPFEQGVTILDLLFNVGRDAPRYMKFLAEDRWTSRS
jgi:hypothetical protein